MFYYVSFQYVLHRQKILQMYKSFGRKALNKMIYDFKLPLRTTTKNDLSFEKEYVC